MPFKCSKGNSMEWKIIEFWEMGDKDWIEMARGIGEKGSSVLGSQGIRIIKGVMG